MDFIDICILFLIVLCVLALICKACAVAKTVQRTVMGGGKNILPTEYKLDRKMLPVLTPEFNFREIAKQCILLEEHLNQPNKTCLDCQKKHFLTAEGLIEEAISLDKEQKYTDKIHKMFKEWIRIEQMYVNKTATFEIIAQEIRKFRKPLMSEWFKSVGNYDI